MSARSEYDVLVKNGVLEEIFPGFSGDWEKDKNRFTRMWEMNNAAIKEIDTDYDEQ